MRHVRYRTLGLMCVAALTLGMILSGCGASTTATVGQKAAASTATTAATDTPFPTAPTAPIDQIITMWPGCPPLPNPTQPKYVAVGDLDVSIPQRLDDSSISALMPNNAPYAPYKVSLTPNEALWVGAFHPNPPVNPELASGYVFQFCNKTSASHTLTSMRVNIASFSASSGPVTVWHICQGGPYDAATKQTTPGCGSSGFAGAQLTATLLSDSTGASASVTGTTWPVTIGPNQAITIVVAVNGLTSQGAYALKFGVSVDGASPWQMTPSDGAFLMAPSAIVWTGIACLTPAMQARIPATTQDTYYVCPPIS